MPDAKPKAPKVPAKAAAYHHGDLRNALVAAAEQLLHSEDPEALSLRAVARAAGVSAAAPYHHFASKEELLAAVAAKGFLGLAAEMQTESDRRTGALDRMVGVGVGYVRWARTNPKIYALMYGQGRYLRDAAPELTAATNASGGILKSHVAAIAAEQSNKDEKLVARIVVAAWGLVHGLAELMADGAVGPSKDESLDAYIEDILRRGVAGLAGRKA